MKATMLANRRTPDEQQNPFHCLAREEQMIDDLFDLIGGRRTVSAATEAFYRRVLADETLRPFFATTDMEQLLARQRMFLSMLLGGKVVYTGQDIGAVHARVRGQGLNDGHFDRFLKHFREALNEVGVEHDKIKRVAKVLESRRSAVLNP
ncbi:MAG TPA: group 1 truncated hemoglobin [Candidatus Acidoferrum sp.]|nr:group 1 truncated hemoglobin [Candidatus Acidoferrum sp.]